MQHDRRPAQMILAEPRWQPLRHLAGSLELTQLRDIDRLLRLCEAEGIVHMDDVTEEMINNVDVGSLSQAYPMRLSRALSVLLPGTALADRASRVASRRKKNWLDAKNLPKKGRDYVATKTVPERQLPALWRSALADMRMGLGSQHDCPPAPKIIETISMKLRQLAKSALDHGLPVELSLDAIGALHSDMNSRNLSSSTKRATTSALARFANFIGADNEIRAELRRVTAYHDGQARFQSKRKERVLAEVDVSFETVLTKAQSLLHEASGERDPHKALARRNEAFSLAFFMVLPHRLNDTRLTFGKELTWDGSQWNLDLTTSKTEVQFDCRIHPYLTPFIDALLLNGLTSAYLESAREACVSKKRPVLLTRSDKAVAYGYVSDVWRKYFKTGEHITRTEIHQSFAVALGVAGTELALAACGQRSAQSAAHYHAERVFDARLTSMQIGMLELADDLPPEAFET